MPEKTKEYPLLLASVFLFYVIITFPEADFDNLPPVVYVKWGLGLIAVIYLIVYNIKRLRSSRKAGRQQQIQNKNLGQ